MMNNTTAPAAHHNQPPLFFGCTGCAEREAGRDGGGWVGSDAFDGAGLGRGVAGGLAELSDWIETFALRG